MSRTVFRHTEPTTLLQNAAFHVELFRYPAGIEAVRISNQCGAIVVLPFYGQMVWDACFDGQRLLRVSLRAAGE